MTISRDVQGASPGELIILFELDLQKLGGGVLHFTSSAYSNSEIVWNGNTYTPVDIEADGFEYSGQAAFPTPSLRLSNVTQLASALVITYEDLIGAQVRRIRTFSQYLDNGPTPDPGQIYPIDVYNIEQKVKHSRSEVEWKLSAAIDQQGVKIPSETLVRDYCSRQYRIFENGAMSYKEATCRYAGSGYFTITDEPTSDPSQDRCSKTLPGCKARFGANSPLPFKGCPGLGRFR